MSSAGESKAAVSAGHERLQQTLDLGHLAADILQRVLVARRDEDALALLGGAAGVAAGHFEGDAAGAGGLSVAFCLG